MKEKRVQVKRAFRKNLVFFWGILMFFCVAGAVQAAEKPQPPPRFQEVEGSNGSIIRDNTTRLEWQRCPYGQSWTGSFCSGAAWKGKWEDAVRITASGGFRVPTIDELKTLAPYDQNVFPGTYYVWSSSPSANNSFNAWLFLFGNGSVFSSGKDYDYPVRLVRSGQ